MGEIKHKIEKAFEVMGIFLYRNPIKSLLFIFAVLGGLLCQIPQTTVDTSSKAMFREDDTSLIDFKAFLDQFGRADYVVIAVEAEEIFDFDFLTRLKALHDDLKSEVPNIRNINSLLNARNTRGSGDTLIIEELLKGFPEEKIDLNLIKERVMNNPYYLSHIISEKGNLTAVLMEIRTFKKKTYESEDLLDNFESEVFIGEAPVEDSEYLTARDDRRIVEEVQTVVNRHNSQGFSLSLAGGIVLIDAYNKATANDLRLCMILGSIVVIVFLALLFRRLSGVILPVVVVEMAVFSTLGLMALLNSPITELSMVIPAFLLSVGVADSVHVLTIFYRHLDQGNNKEAAIAFAMGHSGLAIVMTSLTTAAGLFSFYFAELVGIADMGMFAASGVMMALFCTIAMLPPLVAVFPIKQKKHNTKKGGGSGKLDTVLQFFAEFSVTHPKKIIIASVCIFVLSAFFVTQLRFSHDSMTYFPDSMPIKKALMLMDREFRGITTLEVILDTQKENGIHDPDLLTRIEKISNSIKKIKTDEIYVGKVSSIIDILKETNQALHENNPDYYSIPEDRETIAQELLLFETSGSEDLERIVDTQFSKTRITIKTPNVDAVIYKDFIADIEQKFHNMFRNKAEITITGGVVLVARTVPAALHSMAKSYIIAFFVITIMMIFLVGSLKIGLLSMIPNLLPIIFVMGIMGALGINLNLTTMMIGSIAIGLVVDDTVHFIYNFQRYFTLTGDVKKAIEETFMGTGRALLITSVILTLGFFVLMLASLHHMIKFGFFTGIVIIFALLADFTVAPALMALVTGKSKRKNMVE